MHFWFSNFLSLTIFFFSQSYFTGFWFPYFELHFWFPKSWIYCTFGPQRSYILRKWRTKSVQFTILGGRKIQLKNIRTKITKSKMGDQKCTIYDLGRTKNTIKNIKTKITKSKLKGPKCQTKKVWTEKL